MAPIEDGSRGDANARTSLVRLSAAAFLAYGSYSMCRIPLLPIFARELGADLPTVGLIVGASTLTGVVLKLPAGACSDLVGRRRVLVAGALVFAVLPFTYLAVSTLTMLFAVRAVHGSATAIFGPTASARISDLAPVSRRATWLSSYSTCQGLGQALGPIVAGYLIAAHRFDLAFIVAGLLACAVPFMVAAGERSQAALTHRASWSNFKQGVAEVGGDRLILLTSATQAGQFVLNGALSAFLPLYGREVLGLTVTELGWLFGIQTLSTLASRPLMGAISDRVGRRAMIVGGLALCSIAVALLPVAAGLGELIVLIFAYAIGVAVSTAATSAFITDLARSGRYGTAHGVFGTIYDVGDAFGPIAAGLLVASVGYTRMFQAVAAIAAVMTAAFWRMSQRAAAA